MPNFPPMPPAPSPPISPHIFAGILTDRIGNNISSGEETIFVNETNTGSKRVLTSSNGEILVNLANISSWSVSDNVRIQVIDDKGNGEVYYKSPLAGAGTTLITNTIRAINPVIAKRLDKFTCRSVIKA